MWTAIGTTVLKSVADAVLNQKQPNNNSITRTDNHDGNYNIQGHINHFPVDVSINRGSGSSHGSSSYRPEYRPPPTRSFDQQEIFGPSHHQHQNMSFTQATPLKTQKPSSYNGATNNNSNNVTRKQKNPKRNNDNEFVVVDKPRDKPKTGNTNKPKNSANTFCMVKMPSHGNFKIHIEKSESNSSRMNANAANNNKFHTGNNDNRQESKNRQFKQQNPNQKNNSRMFNNGQKSQQSGNPNNGQNTWMYIGKLKLGTSKSDLSSYLGIKFPKNQFKIHTLPLYKDGKLPCFKVLVDNSILHEFELLGNWPTGVTIKKYQHNFKA